MTLDGDGLGVWGNLVQILAFLGQPVRGTGTSTAILRTQKAVATAEVFYDTGTVYNIDRAPDPLRKYKRHLSCEDSLVHVRQVVHTPAHGAPRIAFGIPRPMHGWLMKHYRAEKPALLAPRSEGLALRRCAYPSRKRAFTAPCQSTHMPGPFQPVEQSSVLSFLEAGGFQVTAIGYCTFQDTHPRKFLQREVY